MSFQGYQGLQPGQADPGAGEAGQPAPGPQGSIQPIETTGGQFGSPSQIPQEGSPGGDSKTTLWMGELEPWVDENYIRTFWFNLGETVNVKMIRDKFTGNNAGYCFIDFQTPQAAGKALSYNGQILPNSTRPLKLNWASGGGLQDRSREERGPEYSIFVGDLGPDVNEFVLLSLFQNKYKSCKSAKIMTDPLTGMSRGYGFVRFTDESEQQRALSEMQGVYCGNRPMRISTATPKNKGGPAPNQMGMPGPTGPMNMYNMGAPPMSYYGLPQPMNQFTDPNNTTVFVGGLSGYVTEDELRSFFQGFGEITYVKIPPGKGCGFVQFVQRHAAEMAINQMQGYPIGNSRVRLSWGRSQNNSGPAGTPYRPAPPPPVYPAMGVPPHHAYQNFAPMKEIIMLTLNSSYNAHLHSPLDTRNIEEPHLPPVSTNPQDPQSATPGAVSQQEVRFPVPLPGSFPTNVPGPLEPVSVELRNGLDEGDAQARRDRLEAESRGWDGVYAGSGVGIVNGTGVVSAA